MMKKLLYFFMVFFISLFASVHSVWATDYYRGDKRSPEEIKQQGGFYPQTYVGGAPTIPQDMSLYQHVDHPELNSGYVSTSSSERVARQFGAGGYLYTIQGDINLVNAAQVLGEFYQRPTEQEFAALGGVPWRQIIGWERLNDRGSIVGEFIDNPDYAGDAAFTGEPNPNPAQVIPLAGFPYNHPAWRMAPWNQYPFDGCGGFGSSRSTLSTQDQCEASERYYEWRYLSQYRTAKGITKIVVFKGSTNSKSIQLPTELASWIDMDGTGKLSLCGLFYDSEGSNTKITCLKNNGLDSFSPFKTALGDYGWSAGRAFTIQYGKAAYCRVVSIIWNQLQCASSSGTGYFNNERISGIEDAGYNDTRTWQPVYRNGTTALCRIRGNIGSGFNMTCSGIDGRSTRFPLADMGWSDSRMWLDISGKGVGHASFCRLIGLAGNIRLQCRVRLDDNNWSNEITGPSRDGGYAWYRFPVRMHGSAQEYCAVTGYYYDGLTCSRLTSSNTISNYSISLPKYINSSTKDYVSFSDVDGDGLEDLCFLDGARKAVYCYLNKGGSFNSKFVTLKLSGVPLNSFASQITKIMPIEYTDSGPITSVCYHVGYGVYRCDKFLVY